MRENSLYPRQERAFVRNTEVRMDLIPLVNIIFLLLMFFIVSGNIRGRLDEVDIPVSSLERPTFIREEEDMVIYVDKVGHVRLHDNAFMPWSEAENALSQEIGGTGRHRIILAVDGLAPSGIVHKLLSLLQRMAETGTPIRAFLVLSSTEEAS